MGSGGNLKVCPARMRKLREGRKVLGGKCHNQPKGKEEEREDENVKEPNGAPQQQQQQQLQQRKSAEAKIGRCLAQWISKLS